MISLFQTERSWLEIREQVMHLVDAEHCEGRAQNGQLVQDLEHRLAEQFDRQYCISVANCTDALTIALMSLKLPPGSRIAVSDYTFVASATAIFRAGYHAVPVDVAQDYCVSAWPHDVDAIVAVDIFGNMCDLPVTDVPIIIDAAQSLESHNGVNWSAQRGRIACLSFSPSKTVSSWGSGGAILTDDPEIFARAKLLRLYGRDASNNTTEAGINSMLSTFEAACIWAGLDRHDAWQQRRNKITQHLVQTSRFSTGIDLHLSRHTFHKLVFQTPDRTQTMSHLRSQGVESVVHYTRTVHQHPWFTGRCPNSAELALRSFTVPNQHTLTDSEVEHLARALK